MHALSVIVSQVVISFTDMSLYYMVLGRNFVFPLKRCMPMYHLTVIPRPTTYRPLCSISRYQIPFSCFISYINRPHFLLVVPAPRCAMCDPGATLYNLAPDGVA